MSNGEVMDQTTALAPLSGPRGVALRSLGEVERFATLVYKTSLVPKEYRDKLGDVVGIIFYGLELGLNPLQALQGIMFVNGRPSVWGDTMLGLVEASGLLESFAEIEPAEAQTTGIGSCTLKRRGRAAITRTYTAEMAKTAKLWGKAGPWTEHSGRMLQMRARGWALRDAFADVLKGLYTVEEARDIVLTPDTTGTWSAAHGSSDREPSAAVESAPPQEAAPSSEPRAGTSPAHDGAIQDLLLAIGQALKARVPRQDQAGARERLTLMHAYFGVEGWTALSALDLATLQAGMAKLSPVPTPEPDEVPADPTPDASGPPAPVVDPGGYVMGPIVEEWRSWARVTGVSETLEDLLRICPGFPDAPQVTPGQYERFTTTLTWARQAGAAESQADVPF